MALVRCVRECAELARAAETIADRRSRMRDKRPRCADCHCRAGVGVGVRREMGRFAWAACFIADARPVARDVCACSTVRARPARAKVGVSARGEFSNAFRIVS